MSRFVRHALFGAALALLGSVSQAQVITKPAPAPTALEISIGGIGPGVDATAFKKVKLLISDALFKDTIDYFDVYGYGKEGGFSACVEKGRFAAEGSFETFIKALRAIRPNRTTTAYNVSEVALCTYPTNPLP